MKPSFTDLSLTPGASPDCADAPVASTPTAATLNAAIPAKARTPRLPCCLMERSPPDVCSGIPARLCPSRARYCALREPPRHLVSRRDEGEPLLRPPLEVLPGDEPARYEAGTVVVTPVP